MSSLAITVRAKLIVTTNSIIGHQVENSNEVDTKTRRNVCPDLMLAIGTRVLSGAYSIAPTYSAVASSPLCVCNAREEFRRCEFVGGMMLL